MKIRIQPLILSILACTMYPISQASADQGTSPADISKQILHMMKGYAASTGCESTFDETDPSDPSRTTKKDIVALVPLGAGADTTTSVDPVWEAQEYAVLWSKNCEGGNGTNESIITLVNGSSNHKFKVNTKQKILVESDPSSDLKLLGAAPNKIIYSSTRSSDKDTESCASKLYHYTVERNDKSVWKETSGKYIGLSDCAKKPQ